MPRVLGECLLLFGYCDGEMFAGSETPDPEFGSERSGALWPDMRSRGKVLRHCSEPDKVLISFLNEEWGGGQ